MGPLKESQGDSLSAEHQISFKVFNCSRQQVKGCCSSDGTCSSEIIKGSLFFLVKQPHRHLLRHSRGIFACCVLLFALYMLLQLNTSSMREWEALQNHHGAHKQGKKGLLRQKPVESQSPLSEAGIVDAGYEDEFQLEEQDDVKTQGYVYYVVNPSAEASEINGKRDLTMEDPMIFHQLRVYMNAAVNPAIVNNKDALCVLKERELPPPQRVDGALGMADEDSGKAVDEVDEWAQKMENLVSRRVPDPGIVFACKKRQFCFSHRDFKTNLKMYQEQEARMSPNRRLRCASHQANFGRFGCDGESPKGSSAKIKTRKGIMSNSLSFYHRHVHGQFYLVQTYRTVSRVGALLRSDPNPEGIGMITLTVQGSFNRLKFLPKLASKWKGPISVSILLNSESELKEFDDFLRKVGDAVYSADGVLPEDVTLEDVKNFDKYVDIHMVTLRKQDDGSIAPDGYDGGVGRDSPYYPINMLRNIALQQVKTEYVFVVDIDPIPNAEMQYFVKWVKDAEESAEKLMKREDRQCQVCPGLSAFIVPAIESVIPELANDKFPSKENTRILEVDHARQKQRVQEELKNTGYAAPMHPYFPIAYGPTDYNRWLDSKDIYEVAYSYRFEPYYIAKMNIPFFNSSFINRGGNFAEQVYQMAAGGYRFFVLPDAFVIDIPHATEKTKNRDSLVDENAALKEKKLKVEQKDSMSLDVLTEAFDVYDAKYGLTETPRLKEYWPLKRDLERVMKEFPKPKY